MKYIFVSTALFCTFLFFSNCKETKDNGAHTEDTSMEEKQISKPFFNADSAYAYIETQVNFGPRVPGTDAQEKCADWMEQQLRQSCDTVFRQDVTVTAGNGQPLPCFNLIGSINPQSKKRILLLAHWDSRPWADMDTKDTDKPILGADDGASGVGVLLALAKAIQSQPLPEHLGIDILLTDVEDYGKSEWGDNSYALGAQYWARHPHVPNYRADFGILLDMVGGKNARFPLEGLSAQYAPNIQQMVWRAASTAGYSSYFLFERGSSVTDDHVFVNNILHIPTIDIIHLTTNPLNTFPSYWHTHGDNMSVIDKNTLKAVGETLLQVIYEMGSNEPSI